MSKKLEKSYQLMIDWNEYRLEQNSESLKKLNVLLSQLEREEQGDPAYEKDIVDLDSLKIIYETGLRNFDGQIQKYKELLASVPEKKVDK